MTASLLSRSTALLESEGYVLAIDPGNAESAYALIDGDRRPIEAGKKPNRWLASEIPRLAWNGGRYVGRIAIEMVASYGMAVGADVFDTCVWVGRFAEISEGQRIFTGAPTDLVYRRDVKLHHCGSARAKDANVTQALIDRFAPNTPNKGKGTKVEPGWFYGFKADIWQAYALAVYVADTRRDLS